MPAHEQPTPEDLADLQAEMPECHDVVADQFELPDDFAQQAAELGRAELSQMPEPPVSAPAEGDWNVDWKLETQPGEARRATAQAAGPAGLGLVVRLGGHVLFGVLGLVIGYYILCWIEPRGNFLNLPLPGIERVAPGGNRLR